MSSNTEISAESIYKDLKSYIDKWEFAQAIKDDISLSELNDRYRKLNHKYLKRRRSYHKLILSDKKLYREVKDLAKRDLLFDILVDGWSYDINRARQGEDPTLAFIPFPFQVDLIRALEQQDKHVHIEKSRRMGASIITRLLMKRDLIHGDGIHTIATHKDLESLDGGEDDLARNSTFEGVRWMLDKSNFIPKDWRDEKKYWHKKVKVKVKKKKGKDSKYRQKKIKLYRSKERKLSINGNTLKGAVLGKGTNVGSASHKIITDEIAVSEDMYPKALANVLGSFVASVNQVIALSTYRRNDDSFCNIKDRNETQKWRFVELDWRKNPICNNEWYENMCIGLGRDEVLIARELDRDPTKSRRGLILPEMNKDRHLISFNELPLQRYIKVAGADFGGGESNTVFILGYLDQYTGRLFLSKTLKGTKFKRTQIGDFFEQNGFKDVIIRGDRSGLSSHSTEDSSWAWILKEQGLRYKAIDNRKTLYQHAHINISFEEDKIFIDENNRELFRDLSNANYKLGQVNKDKFSHTFDALLYLFKDLNKGMRINVIDY
jgi:hypothetical protein